MGIPAQARPGHGFGGGAVLTAGAELLMDLASRYTHMTRITTRLSAEEMTFDPMFEARPELVDVRPTQTYGGISVQGCEEQLLADDRATAQLSDTSQVSKARRALARAKTILTEQELARAAGGAETPQAEG